MPGAAFASGDSVSLHPIEEEDHEFLQYGHNHPDIRRPLGSSTIRSRCDVEEMVEDDEYRFLVCVDECSESSEGANGEVTSSVATRNESAEDASHGALEPVGVVALPWVFEDTQSAFLMYWIAPEHQGHGYATNRQLTVTEAVDAVEQTRPGHFVDLVTHEQHGHPVSYLYKTVRAVDRPVTLSDEGRCSCGGYVTRVTVSHHD